MSTPKNSASLAESGAVGDLDPAAEVGAGFPVTSRPTWLMLLGVALIMLAGLVWAVLGNAPDSVAGRGIIVPTTGFDVVGQAATGTVEKVAIREGDVLAAGALVATVRESNGKLISVTTEQPGRVAAVLVRQGVTTTAGTSIATMVPLNEPDVATGFLPAGKAKRVQPGMPAQIAVDSVPSSQYGMIVGVVTEVAAVPASAEQILLEVGDNESLSSYFLELGPVIAVTVELKRDPSTPTGYEWTVGSGPPGKITTGSLTQVEVILSNDSPIERLL